MKAHQLDSPSRRVWIKNAGLFAMGGLFSQGMNSCIQISNKGIKTILVVSGWQDVNIGDIAHTPGLLHILETFFPKTKIILWKRSVASHEVKQLLNRHFPEIKVIYGDVDDKRNVDNPEVTDAFKKADIMVHGSGPKVVGHANLEAWIKYSEKPFGIFGVTIKSVSKRLKKLLTKASFVYTRETDSLKVLEKAGISGKHIAFAPDATFYMDIHNEQKATLFLNESGLEEKKFICAIPRLRKTPYYKINPANKWSGEKIRKVDELNNKYKESDHSKLREAMITWVRKTGNKVLVCPEMTYQVEIMDELLIDPLPADVKPFVVKRGYWMPDEAASLYARAHTVLSFECHSPIISLANNTPAVYLRQPEDGIKGQMYYDLGFNDWVFEIEESTGEQITDELMKVFNNYEKSLQALAGSMEKVNRIYKKLLTHIL